MSSAPEDEMVPAQPPQPPQRPPRLSVGVGTIAVILLAIPCVALALVPTYSSATPVLWGWPFFYWYQVLWIILTPILTYAAYLLIKKARGK